MQIPSASEQPPIPSPEATCAQCGQVLGTTRAKYCPNCGAALRPESSALSGLKIFGAICLGMVAFLAAGLGACFLLISGFGGQDSGQILGFAVGLFLFTALLIFGMVKLLKR